MGNRSKTIKSTLRFFSSKDSIKNNYLGNYLAGLIEGGLGWNNYST